MPEAWSIRCLRAGLAVAAVAALVLVPAGAPATAAGCDLPRTERKPQRPWAQDRLDVERVWPLTTGAGQYVAVVDSGVDGAQPQLHGHVTAGYDVLTGRPGANTDCQGHGTFVAGIIAAQPATGIGFAGMAPGAMIVPIRETNSTDVNVGDLAEAIRRATQTDGVREINVSTTTQVDDPRLRQAVAAAQSADIVVVAAAGNEAQSGDTARYPAVYPGVLAVGAIDSAGNRAEFSETVGVDVVAPGEDLLSTGAGGTGLVSSKGGTSFSAPYVTGVVALVRAYHPGLSAAQVVHRIEVTADHPAGPLPDPQFGWGVVDPYAAVTAVLPEEGPQPVVAPSASKVPLVEVAPLHRDNRRELAYLVAAAAVVMGGLLVALLWLVPLGHRRGWRPALRDPR